MSSGRTIAQRFNGPSYTYQKYEVGTTADRKALTTVLYLFYLKRLVKVEDDRYNLKAVKAFIWWTMQLLSTKNEERRRTIPIVK